MSKSPPQPKLFWWFGFLLSGGAVLMLAIDALVILEAFLKYIILLLASCLTK